MLREVVLLLMLLLLLLLPVLSRPPRLLGDERRVVRWRLLLLLLLVVLLLWVVAIGVRLMISRSSAVVGGSSGFKALPACCWTGVGVIVVRWVEGGLAIALLVSRWALRWPIGWGAWPRAACSGGGACRRPPPGGSLARRQVERAAGNHCQHTLHLPSGPGTCWLLRRVFVPPPFCLSQFCVPLSLIPSPRQERRSTRACTCSAAWVKGWMVRETLLNSGVP